MPLLPGMVRDGREFSFRPISPEGLTGDPEDVDSDGRGLNNRLSPADRGKIFYQTFMKIFIIFSFSSWRGERQWSELHELQERVRISESGGRQPGHHAGSYRAGQAGRARDSQRCRHQPGGASQPQCRRSAPPTHPAGPASAPAAAPVTPAVTTAAPRPPPSDLPQCQDPGGPDLPQPGTSARGPGPGAGAAHHTRHSVSAFSRAEAGGRRVSSLSVRHLCPSLQQRR